MSASENGWDSGPHGIGEDIVGRTLIGALPEIVAVVREGEAVCADCGPCNGGVTTDPSWRDGRCPFCGRIREALATLARKLPLDSETGETSAPPAPPPTPRIARPETQGRHRR